MTRSSTSPADALTAGACLAAVLAGTAFALSGATDPVPVPVAPPAVAIAAAACGALLVVASRLRSVPRRVTLAAGGACTAGMLAGCVLAVPHTVLIAVVWAASRLTGGTGPFDIAPQWVAAVARLVTVAAAVLLAVWTVGPLGDRARPGPRFLAAAAALSVVACLPYGLLKLSWALGSTLGLTGHAFDGVAFSSPGFGDTAVLTGLSIVVSVLMGARVTGTWLRPVLGGVGAVGSLMLLPVGLYAGVEVAFGAGSAVDAEIAPWVFPMVYGCMAVWGVALCCLTVGYWRSTGVSAGSRISAR